MVVLDRLIEKRRDLVHRITRGKHERRRINSLNRTDLYVYSLGTRVAGQVLYFASSRIQKRGTLEARALRRRG